MLPAAVEAGLSEGESRLVTADRDPMDDVQVLLIVQ
jgi:hypothetical protein